MADEKKSTKNQEPKRDETVETDKPFEPKKYLKNHHNLISWVVVGLFLIAATVLILSQAQQADIAVSDTSNNLSNTDGPQEIVNQYFNYSEEPIYDPVDCSLEENSESDDCPRIGAGSVVSRDGQNYLEIPEYGIQLELDDDTFDAVYSYVPSLNSVFLTVQRLEDVGCGPINEFGDRDGVTAVSPVKLGEEYFPGLLLDQETIDKSGIQNVGDNYYVFQKSQAVCTDGSDQTLRDLENTIRSSFRELVITAL